MKADLSRVTFREKRHYSRVLQQQGRPLLDADWNEQVAILHNRLRTLAGDLTGSNTTRAGAPVTESGFEINALDGQSDNFSIGRGRYYVDGLCCECDEDTTYIDQPLGGRIKIDRSGISLIYLDAWESVVTAVDDPDLLEPALSGVDTTVRTHVAWQVRSHRLSERHDPKSPDHDALREECADLERQLRTRPRGMLRARLAEPLPEAGRRPIQGSRAARFRGPENLLYRIEVHKGGHAGEATFKWSRNNGATLLPLASLEGGVASVTALARRASSALAPGTWLEVCDTVGRALAQAEPMVQATVSAGGSGRLDLSPAPAAGYDFKPGQRSDVALRRWDQQSGAENRGGETAGPDGLPIVEGERDAHWLNIEDGIQIQFLADEKRPHVYRPGDYWLIPARTADEGVLLRGKEPQAPDGVDHYYAPLALFVPQRAEVIADYRLSFQPLAALQDQVNRLSQAFDDLASRVAALEGH